jgi:hypothetical protein
MCAFNKHSKSGRSRNSTSGKFIGILAMRKDHASAFDSSSPQPGGQLCGTLFAISVSIKGNEYPFQLGAYHCVLHFRGEALCAVSGRHVPNPVYPKRKGADDILAENQLTRG